MARATAVFRSVVSTALAWGAAVGLCGAQAVTTRVSTDAANAEIAGASRQPSASADGRLVAFSSSATTLVTGDANGSADIFVKDRQTGAVTRVSVRTGGAEQPGDSVSPHLSRDGRFVTFVSAAALVADDTNSNQCAGPGISGPTCPDVYLHDRTTGATTRVSLGPGGAQANAASAAPRLTSDGRYVVFESTASNLVAADTNGVVDVFLRDTQTSTTARVSVSSAGAQSDAAATAPSIGDDGARITFVSAATTLDAAADSLTCDQALLECTRVYLHAVATSTTTRLSLSEPYASGGSPTQGVAYRVPSAVIAGDGQSVAVVIVWVTAPGIQQLLVNFVATYTFASARTGPLIGVSFLSTHPAPQLRVSSLAITRDGRTVASCFRGLAAETFYVPVKDAVTSIDSAAGVGPPIVLGGGNAGQPDCEGVSIADDGLTAFFASSGAALVSGDTNAALDVFAFNRDPDDDGMPSEWEAVFGLDPANPADGALDADADGATNLQEFENGTHPRGLFKHYFAEGADNAFFTTEINVFNPHGTAGSFVDRALVVAEFLGQNGQRNVSTVNTLFGRGTSGYASGFQPLAFPDQAFATIVESDRLLAVERTLSWGGGIGSGYGSHAETATTGPAATWHFAEGATHGGFDLFYLLQNPSSVTVTATITYLRPAPQAPIVRAYTVLPKSRRTIWVDEEPGLAATDVSARIDADQPILVERALYLSTPGQPFAGGAASAGILTPATEWFIAEGATGTFFDLFILIGNPSSSDAQVTISYLLPSGTAIDRSYTVAAQSRRTISVKGEDAQLAATAVSATVTSTNAIPIVVERAMWWPSPAWYEGTVTAAATQAGTRWALAGGFVDSRPDTQTYLLIANPGTTPANVTIDLGGSCQTTAVVPGRGRYTVGLKSVCPLATNNPLGRATLAGTIVSDGPPIVVERSTYWSAGGQFWAAGASTVLTRVP